MISLAGALILTLYQGIPLSNSQEHATISHIQKGHENWIKGSFLLSLGVILFSSWMLIQAKVNVSYPCPYSEAAELRRQAEKDGVRVYLEKPNVRHRPNSRFLTATVLGVKQSMKLDMRRCLCIIHQSPLLIIGVNELTEGDHDTDSASVTCSIWKSERAKICSCKCCGKKYHRNCLKQWAQHRDLFNWSSWACPSCRTCETLTSAATMERLGGGNIVQPSLSTRDALDKYHIVTQKMEDLVANNAGDGEIQYSEVPEIILRCISKDEAALAVAQSSLHVSANLAILVTIRG
ncbi:hypothetical protein DY000_02040374, partial [Brassica cretica]